MEEAIIQWLLDTTTVTDLVGDRLCWSTLPQGILLPAVVLTIVSRVPEYSVDSENKLTNTRLQVDCWGLEYDIAKNAGRAIFNLLSAAKTTIANVEFQAIYGDREQDFFEQGTGNRDLWRNSQDYMIWHAATT